MIYQVDHKTIEDQPKSFQTTINIDKEDVVYSDESFDEVIINFVNIETSCSKCHSYVLSKSKLHQ